MRFPAGSVQALSSASSTVFSIGIVFLGYWGVHEGGRWSFAEVMVVVVALAAFACLGAVPWLATTPVASPEDERMQVRARWAFLLGVAGLWLAVAISLFT
jgi:hypothetical protein